MALRIDTLGTLRIAANGTEQKALQAQKLRCSLLVFVGVEGTTTRDQVLLHFWPDRPDDRARHALSQSLYELRRTLGDDWLETHGDQLVVTDAVTVDATAFERALASGAREQALRLYRGPFLQGHHLHETRGFEGWVEQQRAQLARRHRQARREQIGELIAANAPDEVYRAARDWVEVEPLEDEAQHRLIEAMVQRGERAAAIRQYERYRELVRRELDVEPLEEITALIERVRTERAPAPRERAGAREPEWQPLSDSPAVGEPTGGDPDPRPVEPRESGPNGRQPLVSAAPRAAPSGRRRRMSRRTWLAGAAAFGAAFVVAVVAYGRMGGPDATPVSERSRAVVLPFEARADTDLAATELEDQLAGWLELGLHLQVVERSAGAGARPASTSDPASLDRVRSAGATIAIAPFVADGRLVADVLDPTTGRTLFRSSAPPAPDLRSAIPHLALQLMRTLAGAGLASAADPAALESTTSPEALRQLLEARLAFFHGDSDRAETALRAASRADSASALPYHRLSMAYLWSPRWDYPRGIAVLDSGLQRLAPSDSRGRRLLDAQRHYAAREGERAIRAFEGVTVDHPDLTDAWVGLGEAVFHFGGSLGLDRLTADRPLREAIRRDSLAAPVYYHLAELAVLKGEDEELAQLPPAFESTPEAKEIRAMRDLRFGDSARVAATLERLRREDRRTILFALASAARGNRDPALADRLAALLLEPGRTPEERLWGARYDLITSAGRDDWPEALRRWDEHVKPSGFDPWIVQAELAGHPTGGRAAEMLTRARATLEAEGPPDLAERPNQPLLQMGGALVTHALLHGALTDVAELRTLLQLPADTTPRMADPAPHYWRQALSAREALLTGDTTAAIAALRSAVSRVAYPYVFTPFLGASSERLMLAELLSATGRAELADRWHRSFAESEFLVDVLFLNRPRQARSAPGT
ncbi:MAG: hypothetical protein KY466_03310 [Gemmatimonadetes bacterium]|nr:hypothetical protein [Gemmatimonadota bacterium]